MKSLGEPGSGPGQFNTPHTIAIDAKGNIYVADRGNRRIQVFDSDGKFLREIKIDVPVPAGRAAVDRQPRRPPDAPPRHDEPGAPWAICITPGPTPGACTPPTPSRAASTS